MRDKIAAALEKSRQELLDLGIRGNSLLNFVPRAVSLTVHDALSTEIFTTLIENQKKLSFLPIPKEEKANPAKHTDRLPELFDEEVPRRRTGTPRLQTKLTEDQLDKKLLKINTEAEAYNQEQGIDILYLAIGFLTWYEDKNSDLERNAPLVLIPVALKRIGARERYKLQYTGVDLDTNLILKAKLDTEFQIDLPDFTEETDLPTYFQKVRKAIKKEERWRINENEIHLGFFQFGKFQMYQDLDAKNWPEEKQPADHPIIQSLFGDGFQTLDGVEGDDLIIEDIERELQNLENFHFIADADSSQTEAVIKIKNGKNLVIQGPPGTGKSQTITNIIAESLADNKKILFVSEKMVALEVVKRRLDNCHLGDAVLELHSYKSNKKNVLQELGRTLDLGKPNVSDREIQIKRYKDLKNNLDNYALAVGSPILNSEINFVKAVGLLLEAKHELEGYEAPELSIPDLEKWSKKEFSSAVVLLKNMIAHLEENGPVDRNPFLNAKVESFSPAEKEPLGKLLVELLTVLSEFQKDLAQVVELNVSQPTTVIDVQKLINTIKYTETMPQLLDVEYLSSIWLSQSEEIETILAYGKKTASYVKKYEGILLGAAFEQDMLELRKTYINIGTKWYRFVSPQYNNAKRSFKALLKEPLPSNLEVQEVIDDIIDYQETKKKLNLNGAIGTKLYLDKWKGADSNWKELENIYAWLFHYYTKAKEGEFESMFLSNLDKIESFEKLIEKNKKLEASSTKLQGYFKKLEQLIDYDSQNLLTQDIGELSDLLSRMITRSDDIFSIARFNALSEKMNKKELAGVVALCRSWSFPPNLILTLFSYSWYKSLVNHAYETHDSIKYFDRAGHTKDIRDFRKLDHALAHYSQETLVKNHYESLPHVYSGGEMAIIRREINKKRRHMPIRQLLLQAGNAVQQIKPVFMMSPMSVASFLSPGSIEFDLVIFDEASQVRVVDALIPILRGKQIVVVGDSKQMPPTDFFSKQFEGDDDSLTGDIESILGMFLAQGAYESMLKWHYRSRHDSLINVSNQEFYEGKLMVFPNPGTNEFATGLQFNYVPETIYERGTSRTNPGEARVVAAAVMEHARTKPNLTLGVVAFSTAQRDCILLELERMRREDLSCEDFFSSDQLEAFFVKNLENVQGDERDVIYISIGYGLTAERRLATSFGPVNREGGERRLNVLITRARLAMEVFSNFTAGDLNTSNNSPVGVKALKSFLQYAENGHLENRFETGKDTDSPFEDQVITVIRKMGYEIEPQVGSAGFFIDIAVKDPDKPGKYILAVECDGASYHSSVSARDRDRLRQSVLEGMGWVFHRIWSTDWFRTQQKQIVLLKDAIENAVKTSQEHQEIHPILEKTKRVEVVIQRLDKEEDVLEVKPYILANGQIKIDTSRELLDLPYSTISGLIFQILKIEGPLHLTDAARRIADALGKGRVGNRIYEHIFISATLGHDRKRFYMESEFLYEDETKKVELRDRSNLHNSLKNIENVPPEEIRLALLETIEKAFSISQEEAISEALSKMGFGRATQKASKVVKTEIKKLMKMRKIKMEQERLILS
ncbi:DUF3320 domain-containing protein [Antarcticibacterium flavum]|uniref:DUF3320 domain-containing protein n=1 Tax=Antarcticibacterium flavum TaxID=2058175 RepID=A0A5B7WZG9_9FLAO|nr:MULTISPECIES: DUF3320 domain-containing protein [Antarcticibacterium]MCM4161731.1 DUF3320 domain-containing protein [Antarcticibacterium sp. W02-3]QCY68375.1 DUF3320 domain-containing protein [Antarcticibacterium flavum]